MTLPSAAESRPGRGEVTPTVAVRLLVGATGNVDRLPEPAWGQRSRNGLCAGEKMSLLLTTSRV